MARYFLSSIIFDYPGSLRLFASAMDGALRIWTKKPGQLSADRV